jgi:hypothetical protein
MAARIEVFSITVWVEPDGRAPDPGASWRGCVEHPATQNRLYFRDMAELIGFITPLIQGERDS